MMHDNISNKKNIHIDILVKYFFARVIHKILKTYRNENDNEN